MNSIAEPGELAESTDAGPSAPRHMQRIDGYYWLERDECPPKPELGHGRDADRARLLWSGPGWYGPGTKVHNHRDDREVLYYERASDLASDLADEIRELAARLKTARRFARRTDGAGGTPC